MRYIKYVHFCLRFLWPAPPEPAKSRKIAGYRLIFSGFFMFLVFAAIGGQSISLALSKTETSNYSYADDTQKDRGTILDRKGRILASTVPINILYADPKHIFNPEEVAEALAPLVPNLDKDSLKFLLTKKGRFVELNRKLTPKRHAAILQLGLPGIYVRPSTIRIYPQGAEAAHIIGAVDRDNKGIAGIEKSQDEKLASGRNVTLSIDTGLQTILRNALKMQITKFEALGGAGVILDIKTGEVISATSLPDFDPNHLMMSTDTARFNQVTKGVYEMGSIFKVLNTAIALETGALNMQDSIDVSQPIPVAGQLINDYHPVKGSIGLAEILVRSSNIGSAHISQKIGPKTQKDYMEQLGLLSPSPLEIVENGVPIVPENWSNITAMTVSYGYGISVSMIQAASAIAAAGGDGYYIAPTILKRSPNQPIEKTRIFSTQTAKAVRSMMRLVVSDKIGTGNFADAPGYLVGGKTGTAEKILNKGFNRKANRVSFVATFPANDPAYLILMMVDEPVGQKHSHNYATAGWVVAPAIRDVVTQIAPILGVHPIDITKPENSQNLLPPIMLDGKEAVYASF
ncbi:penicillin-binding protein 2 [Alphaproteobacteria bacterium]|nr:penicillin-binding protein 2 [Alphaproteobacteria bacterium]